jgi:hypothetical protein
MEGTMLKIGKTVRFHNREGRITSISKDGTRVRVSYYHPNNGMVTHCIGADEISQEPEAGHCLRRTCFRTSIPGEEANALAALTGAYDRKQYWLTNLAEVI